MDSTALDFISGALRLLNLIDVTEVASANDAAFGLTVLQELIDGWNIEKATILSDTRTAFNLTANKGSYTFGSGGDFNTTRTNWIDGVGVIPDKTAAFPNEIDIGPLLTVAQFQDIPEKNQTALFPTSAYWDHAFTSAGLSTITVYPIPTSSNAQLVLYLPAVQSLFVDLVTSYTLPPGWPRAIRYNLAVELVANGYEADASDAVKQIAILSLADAKRANFRPTIAQIDAPKTGLSGVTSGYNAYTDQTR